MVSPHHRSALLRTVAFFMALPGLTFSQEHEIGRDPEDFVRLEATARAVLREAVTREAGWVKVHAAEVLLAFGDDEFVREEFEKLNASAHNAAFRVGIWRVLAGGYSQNSQAPRWILAIEEVLRDAASPDRLQAIEALNKLGCILSLEAMPTAHAMANGPDAEAVFAAWALQLAGEPGALMHLKRLLRSGDPKARLRTAYALRWLRPTDEAVLKTLACAAAEEPADSIAHPYLLAAAFSLGAAPEQAASWRARLLEFVEHGSPGVRLEVAQALMKSYTVKDLPRLASLLDDEAGDARIASALSILEVLTHR